jgi:predicted phosphodiesterase
MKVAFLSDIHSNFPALCAALRRVDRFGVGSIVVAGDLIGRGPHPVEVIRLLREQGVKAIRGNVENRLLDLRSKKKDFKKLVKKKKSKMAWTALQLTESEWAYLEALPQCLRLRLGDLNALVVHGSPVSDMDYIYPSITSSALKKKLRATLQGRFQDTQKGALTDTCDILVCGHSHIPFTKVTAGVRVVNSGTVGLPVDGDPRGSFAICDVTSPESIRCRIVRFSYPVKDVIHDIEERDVPGISPEDYLS